MTTILKSDIYSTIFDILAKFHIDIRKNKRFTALFHIPGSDPSTGCTLRNDRMVRIFKNNIHSHISHIPVEFH